MQVDWPVLWNLAIATLGGLAVGVEREWSGHAAGPQARFAGLRTFTMLGLVAGLSGSLLVGSVPRGRQKMRNTTSNETPR